jgi:hypothetical protein
MAWNSSRGIDSVTKNLESGYHTTANNDTSPSMKSRNGNVIVFEKSVIRDIQSSREKIMSNRTKDIESSISHKKETHLSLLNSNIFNKENCPPNPYTDTLE